MAASQFSEQVQQAYLAYYGRPADPAGLAFWTAQVSAAGNFNAIINAFGTSAESTALYAGSNTAAQINAIYNTLFGRNADVAGLNFYVSEINNGTFTLASVALNIYNGAQGTDATELSAKLAYADAFTAAVGQSVSAQIAYSGTAASTNARAAVATVVDTTSEATAQAALPTTLANIGTGTVAQTFALTNGLDSFTPTGNSVISGTIGGSTLTSPSTFTAGDKIVATGTNNTLNIVDLATGSTLPGATTVSGVQTVNLTSGGASGAANFTGYTGLTALNVVEAGGAAGITAAGTTAITLTDSAAANAAINVQGGSNVVVTANAVNGGSIAGIPLFGSINVGTTTAATGTVTVVANQSATATGTTNGGDNINVTGGTVDTITANLSEKAGAGNVVNGGAITVIGGAATTTVTVNQTAAATAANATTASAGAAGTTLATAAPGVQGAAAVAAAPAVAASAAVAGVVDGAVTITDVNFAAPTVAGTITSVSLANFGNASAINDNALTSLSLTGGTGSLTLTNNATAPTNTALALSLNGVGSIASSGAVSAVTFNDFKNEVTTLNVTTAGKDSYLSIADTKLATLNVSGTNALNLSGVLSNTVKTIAVSGAAGFNDGGLLATDTGLTSFTTTSSGKIVATLNATQSFVGSSGQDVITISADATKAITGGSATNNEIIFNGTAASFNTTAAKLTNTNVTGFSVFGLGAAASGNYDLSTFNAGFKAIDITAANFGAGASDSFINAAKGTSLNIAGPSVGLAGTAASDAGVISVSYADTTGAADTVALSIGSGLAVDLTIGGVSLQDANNVGIGTLSVTTSGSDIGNAGGTIDTITTLQDNGLSVLNVSGTAGLTITTLNEATTPATSFTINSTESGLNGTTIGTFTDANLGNLTFTGTAAADVQNLSLGTSTVTSLTIANSGTGTATVGDGGIGGLNLGTTLKSLTLTGNVALGVNAATAETATGATTGFTLSGASDNAHVNFSLTGAASGATDTITLGNGNDYVTDLSTQGKVNITVGTGSNLIDLHTGTGVGYLATVTLGAHTAADSILVGTVAAGVNAANTVITGAAKGDIITLADGTSIAQATAPQQTTLGAAATFAAALTAADTGLASHTALAFQYGGNTYVLENSGALAGNGTLAAGDTLIQLTGAHTVGAIAAGHAFALTA
jgi:S-layer protein